MKDVCKRQEFVINFHNFFEKRKQITVMAYPAEDIENVAGKSEILVALAIHGEAYHVGEYQTQADKLHGDADGEEARHRMTLPAHRVHLKRHQHRINQHEDQVHLERVLVVEREVEGERHKRRLVRVAVHQPEIVLNVRHAGHVEATRLKVVPFARRRVPVAGHQRHVPESAKGREETINGFNFGQKMGVNWENSPV